MRPKTPDLRTKTWKVFLWKRKTHCPRILALRSLEHSFTAVFDRGSFIAINVADRQRYINYIHDDMLLIYYLSLCINLRINTEFLIYGIRRYCSVLSSVCAPGCRSLLEAWVFDSTIWGGVLRILWFYWNLILFLHLRTRQLVYYIITVNIFSVLRLSVILWTKMNY